MTETTADLTAYARLLPPPDELRRRLERLALLDLVLGGGRLPRFRFDARWNTTADGAPVAVGTFDSGGGDGYHAVFVGRSALLRVFDHESVMNRYDEVEVWPGLLDGLPGGLRPYLTDERLNLDPSFPVLTLALWWGEGTPGWQHGRLDPHAGLDPEITSWPLDLLEEWDLDGVYGALSYDHGDASGGLGIDEDAFDALVEDRPLTPALVRALNPRADLDVVAEGAARIGRPLSTDGRRP
ncbi:hypothetical protein QE364_003006 [Nocardioides zeae]|uniref:Uncharacterized protein n=1 Tax=Nocardioides zeae TaxID=1457234 RepID=A0ACC6IKU4_9ACTN|nr:hypothetical protein [Nocardioides zeae]MDR6175223.1 hypothetical protein [Nocardioides zeae]MDR6211285.1 hypothetical protein [Nocardioides zeae]